MFEKFENMCGNLSSIFISDCDVLQLLTGIGGNLSWYSSCVVFLVDIRFRSFVDAWKMLSGSLVVFPFITWSFFTVVLGTSFVESSKKSSASLSIQISSPKKFTYWEMALFSILLFTLWCARSNIGWFGYFIPGFVIKAFEALFTRHLAIVGCSRTVPVTSTP